MTGPNSSTPERAPTGPLGRVPGPVRALPEDHNGACAGAECAVRARWEVKAGAMVYRVCDRHLAVIYAALGYPGGSTTTEGD